MNTENAFKMIPKMNDMELEYHIKYYKTILGILKCENFEGALNCFFKALCVDNWWVSEYGRLLGYSVAMQYPSVLDSYKPFDGHYNNSPKHYPPHYCGRDGKSVNIYELTRTASTYKNHTLKNFNLLIDNKQRNKFRKVYIIVGKNQCIHFNIFFNTEKIKCQVLYVLMSNNFRKDLLTDLKLLEIVEMSVDNYKITEKKDKLLKHTENEFFKSVKQLRESIINLRQKFKKENKKRKNEKSRKKKNINNFIDDL